MLAWAAALADLQARRASLSVDKYLVHPLRSRNPEWRLGKSSWWCQRVCPTAAHRCLGKRTLRRHAVYVQRPCLLICLFEIQRLYDEIQAPDWPRCESAMNIYIGCLTAMNELQRLQPVKPIVYGSMSVFCAGFLFV